LQVTSIINTIKQPKNTQNSIPIIYKLTYLSAAAANLLAYSFSRSCDAIMQLETTTIFGQGERKFNEMFGFCD